MSPQQAMLDMSQLAVGSIRMAGREASHALATAPASPTEQICYKWRGGLIPHFPGSQLPFCNALISLNGRWRENAKAFAIRFESSLGLQETPKVATIQVSDHR